MLPSQNKQNATTNYTIPKHSTKVTICTTNDHTNYRMQAMYDWDRLLVDAAVGKEVRFTAN
jgi:hypothetical protein